MGVVSGICERSKDLFMRSTGGHKYSVCFRMGHDGVVDQ